MLDDIELIGELALDGQLRRIAGVLPTALACGNSQRQLLVPEDNANEAVLAEQTKIFSANHLLDVCRHLLGQRQIQPCSSDSKYRPSYSYPDLLEVKGQQHAKRALEVAAAGGHSLLMIGPPGTGKSMLASRLPGILPEMSTHDALQVAAIESVSSGQFDIKQWRQRPFRNPHHSASSVALVGGGSQPRPGEISLAHKGLLFLDELTEFSKATLEQLREPLETRKINIARANQSVQYPADFLLVAACNPCPCGYLGDSSDRCCCSATKIENYRARLSGPLLDRIDMHLHLARVTAQELQKDECNVETSNQIRQRVEKIQQLQYQRQGQLNCQLQGIALQQHCELDNEIKQFLAAACEKLYLSARAYHRILKLARTIADIENKTQIAKHHISEAIGFRSLDRR